MLTAISAPAGLASSYEEALRFGREARADQLPDLAEKHFKRALSKAQTDDERAVSALEIADLYRAQASWSNALEVLDQYGDMLRKPPHDARRLQIEALSLHGMGRDQDALARLDALPPNAPAALRRVRARILFEAGRVDEADALYRALAAEYGESGAPADLLYEHAEYLQAAGRLERARQLLDRLLNAYPDRNDIPLKLAEIAYDEGRWREALAQASRLATNAARPDIVRNEAVILQAMAWEQLTNTARAVETLEQLTARDERNRAYYEGLALLGFYRFKSGRETDGLRALRDAAVGFPFSPFIADIQLQLADMLYNRERYAEALEEYQVYLEAYSDPDGRLRALRGKAWSLWQLERYAEAASAFVRMAGLTERPDERADSLLKAGDALFRNAQFQRARQMYDQLAAEFTNHPHRVQARYQSALCLRELEHPDAARTALLELEAAYPAHPAAPRAALTAALILEDETQWKEALEVYDRVIERYPDTPLLDRVYHQRGMLRYRLGFIDRALEDFDVILERFAASAYAEPAFFMRGRAYYLLGRNEDALRVCRAFPERFPNSIWTAQVQFWIGEYHYNRGDYTGAEAAFAKVTEQWPRNDLADDALYWAGRAAFHRKEYTRCIEIMSALTRDYPDSDQKADARFAQGEAFSELGQFAEAIVVFDHLIQEHPGHRLVAHAWGRKGDCHFTLGRDDPARYEQARACYQTVLDGRHVPAPMQLQAEYKIGRCEEKNGNPDAALERYMNVVYTHLDYVGDGREGAPVWFIRAAFGAARIKEEAGQWREAIAIYERVVNANIPAGEEARKRIQTIRIEHWLLF